MAQYDGHLFSKNGKNNSWVNMYGYIQANAKVLDVGCANGTFGEALIHYKKCEVTGVDICEEDIDVAKAKLNHAYVMDINDSNATSRLKKYDVIIFADVIEHLINPKETLKNVKKFLEPNGKIVFSIPNMAHSSVRLDLLAGDFDYKEVGLLDRTHLHYYNNNEISFVFNEAGYEIKNINPVVSIYPKQLIASKLKITGLTATQKFYEFIGKTDGNVFQFIGFAQPAKKVIKNKRDLKYVMPQDEISMYASEIIKQNAILEQNLVDYRNKYKKLNLEHENITSNYILIRLPFIKKILRKFLRGH